MSNDKGGFNLSVGGDVHGDVAQSIDKSQHQTTNVAGDVHGDINNSQGTEKTWLDCEGMVDTDEARHDLSALKAIAEGDQDIAPPDGVIDRLHAAAPDALELAGELVARGPFGAAGLAVKLIGQKLKESQSTE